MNNALRELMAPELEQVKEQGIEREVFSSVSEGLYSVTIGARKLHISESKFEEHMKIEGYKLPTLV